MAPAGGRESYGSAGGGAKLDGDAPIVCRPVVLALLLLLVAGLAGALAPLVVRTAGTAHDVVAFSTGVFLVVVLTHLLPEAMATEGEEPGWLVALGGFALLAVLEHGVVRRRFGDANAAMGWTSAIGLTVHALAAGLALAAVREDRGAFLALTTSIGGHKAAETLSFGAVLLLAGAGRRAAFLAASGLALATPLALAVGAWLLADASPVVAARCTAFAAGTFLWVAVGDLVPECLHHRSRLGRVAVLIAFGAIAGASIHWIVE